MSSSLYAQDSKDSIVDKGSFLHQLYEVSLLSKVGQDKYASNYDQLEDNIFIKERWTEGWYYLAGAGYSALVITDKVNTTGLPKGGHLSSAIGYYSEGGYGIEFGSYIDVIDMDDFPVSTFADLKDDKSQISKIKETDLIGWNTLFYFGIRARVPGVTATNNINPFVKVFFGRSVGVFFFSKDEEDYDLSDKRIHLEGPVYGFSITNLFNTNSYNNKWFIELTFTTQLFQDFYLIQERGEAVPTELQSNPYERNTRFSAARITIGCRLF